MALEDPTYKVKIKYIPLPEKKQDEEDEKNDDELSKTNKAKIPMAIQMLNQQQSKKAARTLSKRERQQIKNE